MAKTLEQQCELARQTSLDAHDGQKDKTGNPYFSHVERVALRFNDPKLRAIGYLHDVVEDSQCSYEDLLYLGFDDDIVQAVKALTHKPGDKYDLYISKVARNYLAIQVKLSDLEDNLQRIQDAPKDLKARKEAAYKTAYKYLSEKALPKAEAYNKRIKNAS